MKRIINGKTYNTETATRLWMWDNPYGSGDFDGLYRTRHGAYFRWWGGVNNQGWDFEQIEPLSPPEAQAWMEKYLLDELIEQHFGEQPEAGEGESRITLRIPDSLKSRIEALASFNKQSLNAWIMRCLEGCSAAESSQKRGSIADVQQ